MGKNKIPRNLVSYKAKFLGMSYKVNELHIGCDKTAFYYRRILLQPFLILDYIKDLSTSNTS